MNANNNENQLKFKQIILENYNIYIDTDKISLSETFEKIYLNINNDNNINRQIKYNNEIFNFTDLVYDKKEEKLYYNDREFIEFKKDNEYLYINHIEFEETLIINITVTELETKIPSFKVFIHEDFDGEVNGQIHIVYKRWNEPVCILNKNYKDFNSAYIDIANEKNIFESNKQLIADLIETHKYNKDILSILMEGTLYYISKFENGIIELEKTIHKNNINDNNFGLPTKKITLHNLFNQNYTIISDTLILYDDNNIYKNNKLLKDFNFPEKLKYSYLNLYYIYIKFEQILAQYNKEIDIEKQNNYINQLNKLIEIYNNSKKIIESFKDVFNDDIIFIEKNEAIKFDKNLFELIDNNINNIMNY